MDGSNIMQFQGHPLKIVCCSPVQNALLERFFFYVPECTGSDQITFSNNAENIICTMMMHGETFYGRHMAQHQLQ